MIKIKQHKICKALKCTSAILNAISGKERNEREQHTHSKKYSSVNKKEEKLQHEIVHSCTKAS